MSTTLDLAVKTARRHRQVHAEDVQEWAPVDGSRLTPAPAPETSDDHAAAKAAVLARVVRDVIGNFDWMRDIDRMFRQAAGNQRPNAEAAKRATILVAEFADYAALAQATLRSVATLPPALQPPADELAELQRRGAAAEELAGVYEGEASYFRGDQGTSWDEARKMLGV